MLWLKKKNLKGTTPLSALCTSKCVKGCILRYRLSHFQVWVITPEFLGGWGGNRAKSLEGDGMHCGPRSLLSVVSPVNLELLSWLLNEQCPCSRNDLVCLVLQMCPVSQIQPVVVSGLEPKASSLPGCVLRGTNLSAMLPEGRNGNQQGAYSHAFASPGKGAGVFLDQEVSQDLVPRWV